MTTRAAWGVVLGVLLGAAIWTGLMVVLGIDSRARCVDWMLGVVVAWGARWLARDWRSRALGWTCALCTVPAFLWGRWLLVFLVTSARSPVGSMTEQALLRQLAVTICQTQLDAGVRLVFPEGITLDSASKPEDFPPEVWSEALEIWATWPPPQRQAFADALMRPALERVQRQLPQIVWASFLRSLGPQDLLWGGLAMISAFRLTAPAR